MRFVTVRQLRSKTGEVQEMLAPDEVIVTLNGKPTAVLARLDDASLEPIVRSIRSARVQSTLEAHWASATAAGTHQMTMEEIAAEIAAVRAERRAKSLP